MRQAFQGIPTSLALAASPLFWQPGIPAPVAIQLALHSGAAVAAIDRSGKIAIRGA
jgi:hypothetical protein